MYSYESVLIKKRVCKHFLTKYFIAKSRISVIRTDINYKSKTVIFLYMTSKNTSQILFHLCRHLASNDGYIIGRWKTD